MIVARLRKRPVMNPMTTATEQACIYGKIETIGRKEIGHRPALRNCLAAIAEKMMNGFAKVATTVECPAVRARLWLAGRMETMHGFLSDQQQLQGWRLPAEGFHPVRGFRFRLCRRQQVAAPEMVGRASGNEELRRHLLRSGRADRLGILALAGGEHSGKCERARTRRGQRGRQVASRRAPDANGL